MIDDLRGMSVFSNGFLMRDKAARLAATQNLWNVYRSIYERRGFDIAGKCTRWAEQKRTSLEEYEATASFDNLCKDGCAPLPLAIAMAIFQPLRSFSRKWLEITGTPRQREQKIRAMEKAARALEDSLDSLVDVVTESMRGSTDADSLGELREELFSPSDSILRTATNSYVPDPATTIQALRMYASILNMLQSYQEDTSVTSSDMFAKYLFSAYVFRATGRFHDAEVSTLISAALDGSYDEPAHRMWRNRNYKRIDKSLSFLAEILLDFGKVSAT
jgi:hypothetical protein